MSRANQALLAAHPGNPELRIAVARHTETRDQGRAARQRAAADRQRAAEDRIEAAAAERVARADVQRAQLDEQTGVFAFELGHSALRNEIDRCRRNGDAFVLAHLAVDLAGTVGAGQDGQHRQPLIASLVRQLQDKLRGYDAIVRIEADEFLCGLPGTTLELAAKRFEEIRAVLDHDAAPGQLIVGFAALTDGDDLFTLTDRATADLDSKRNGPR
ncbi:MAG: hypothetical protein JHD16_08475 [Solirubrobacteraceae bacterium]|nr:hypothetical protein [Solirubrobacteraceae bacterium]